MKKPPSPVRYIRTKNVVEGVKIFKTYMNMMSEKVLILLCDVHSSFLIYFSLLLHIYTHLHTPKIPFFQFLFFFCSFMLYCCCWCCSAVIKFLLLTKNFLQTNIVYPTHIHTSAHIHLFSCIWCTRENKFFFRGKARHLWSWRKFIFFCVHSHTWLKNFICT